MIRFGPAGLGGVKDAVANLDYFAGLGLKACEIAFTYGVYIKENRRKEIKEIKEQAKKLDIKLSIHAPYWINLNSKEKRKIEESKKRILSCCKIGEQLGAYCVVFHPGYYGTSSEQETYKNIESQIDELMKEIEKHGWKIKLAPETTGKVNVFGKEDEILKLVKDTGCFFTIDFAHIFARNQGKIEYKDIYKKIRNFPYLHCHFSGIEFSSKGERNHKITETEEIKKLLAVLPENKEIIIINESPDPVGDSVKMLRIYERLSNI